MSIEARKEDHIKIALHRDVSYRKTTWLEWVELVHQAAPTHDPEDISQRQSFWAGNSATPFIIESMTGGTQEAEKINANLAEAAASFNVPMGVGSQRAGIVRLQRPRRSGSLERGPPTPS
jgi:isopentenyl-diphosphate delta-isomerase